MPVLVLTVKGMLSSTQGRYATTHIYNLSCITTVPSTLILMTAKLKALEMN